MTDTEYCVVLTDEAREKLEKLQRSVFRTRTGAAAAIDALTDALGISSFDIEAISVERLND